MRMGGTVRTGALTVLALVAFASNSLLCRLALGDSSVDAATFTTIRLASGAALLALLWAVRHRGPGSPHAGGWPAALALAVYAVGFSYGYVSLEAGMGGLLMFGAVQATIIGGALWRGARAGIAEWLGLALALVGLIYLVAPGLTAPPLVGAALMLGAGVCWGAYTLVGRSTLDPLASTTANFLRATPLAVAVSLAAFLAGEEVVITAGGAGLAIASGALSSALGYAIWYAALPGLGSIRAASVQLLVPVLTAIGGVVLLDEAVTVRLAVGTVLILGGVGLAVGAPARRATVPAVAR
jgi:drug/metabolite transporter (DMT)-like permease